MPAALKSLPESWHILHDHHYEKPTRKQHIHRVEPIISGCKPPREDFTLIIYKLTTVHPNCQITMQYLEIH